MTKKSCKLGLYGSKADSAFRARKTVETEGKIIPQSSTAPPGGYPSKRPRALSARRGCGPRSPSRGSDGPAFSAQSALQSPRQATFPLSLIHISLWAQRIWPVWPSVSGRALTRYAITGRSIASTSRRWTKKPAAVCSEAGTPRSNAQESGDRKAETLK